MRMLLLLVLSVSAVASGAIRGACAQQSPQSYAPQTYAPQTFAPQTHAPQGYAPQTYAPQGGQSQGRSSPRRRLVKCMMSDDQADYCVFYTDRDFRRGSACSCDGNRGSTY